MIDFDLGLDLFPLLAAALAAVGCGLLGNFLLLRRLSLMGDAISHSVLPGLVIAFIVAGSRDPLPMFLGAALAGVATVILVEVVKKLGRVEPGAAMGVVFSILFALGVLLLEQAAVRQVDLDADCVLHGQLETLVWYGAPDTLSGLFHRSTLAAVPRPVLTLAATAILSLLFVVVFFKELRISAFDPALATAQGFSAGLLHVLLMVAVAAATVASFEAVGSILVIAMLIVPAATARLLTDRLLPQLVISVLVAITTTVGGYLAATSVPAIWGKDAVSAAGSMAVASGILLAVAALLSPRHGVIVRVLRRHRLARSVAIDDLLAAMYRAEEAGRASSIAPARAGLPAARRAGFVALAPDGFRLTEAGRGRAATVIRRHRLWEHYLVEHAGLAADHVHETAEHLEHLRTRLPQGPATDPHGKPIPPGTPG